MIINKLQLSALVLTICCAKLRGQVIEEILGIKEVSNNCAVNAVCVVLAHQQKMDPQFITKSEEIYSDLNVGRYGLCDASILSIITTMQRRDFDVLPAYFAAGQFIAQANKFGKMAIIRIRKRNVFHYICLLPGKNGAGILLDGKRVMAERDEDILNALTMSEADAVLWISVSGGNKFANLTKVASPEPVLAKATTGQSSNQVVTLRDNGLEMVGTLKLKDVSQPEDLTVTGSCSCFIGWKLDGVEGDFTRIVVRFNRSNTEAIKDAKLLVGTKTPGKEMKTYSVAVGESKILCKPVIKNERVKIYVAVAGDFPIGALRNLFLLNVGGNNLPLEIETQCIEMVAGVRYECCIFSTKESIVFNNSSISISLYNKALMLDRLVSLWSQS